MPNSRTLQVDNASLSDAIQLHGEAWTEIVRERNLNPTLLPGWIDVVARTYLAREQIRVLLVAEGGTLIGLFPYFLSRTRQFGISLRVVELVTNFVSYHAAIVSSVDQARCLRSLLDSVGAWHVLRFCNVVKGGATADVVTALARDGRCPVVEFPVDNSPYLPIATDWERYLGSRSKKFRYKLRQRQKSLENGPLSVSIYSEGADVRRLLDEIVLIDSLSWKAKHGRDIGSSGERTYYSLLIPYLESLGALHAVVLYYDGRPIAYSLCCSWNRWFGQLKTSFDETFKELSPGGVVIDGSIQAAFVSGAAEFDFLGDMDRHKSAWTDQVRRHSDYFVYADTLRSRAVAAAKAMKNRFIPRARKAPVKSEAD